MSRADRQSEIGVPRARVFRTGRRFESQSRPTIAGRYKFNGKVNDARLKSRRPLQIQRHGHACDSMVENIWDGAMREILRFLRRGGASARVSFG